MAKAINEAISIDDIMQMAKGISNISTGMNKKKHSYSYSSLAKAASNLVAIFPILVSRTVSSETANMISKYTEQKACNLFQLALQQANITSAANGIEYLRNFHQNLDGNNAELDTIIKTIGAWTDAYKNGKAYNESKNYSDYIFNNLNEDNTYYDDIFDKDEIEINAIQLQELMNMVKSNNNLQVYDMNYNPRSINDFSINEYSDGTYKIGIKWLNEKDTYKKKQNKPSNTGEDENNKSNGLTRLELERSRDIHNARIKRIEHAYRKEQDKLRNAREDERDELNRSRFDFEKERDLRNTELKKEEDAYRREQDKLRNDREEEKLGFERDRNRLLNDEIKASRTSYNVSILKDQDIRRMNEAIPALLVVRFYQSTDATVATEFLIGVKSRLIPVTTDEILRRITNDNHDSRGFLNFMRSLTGELPKLDFMFSLSRIKSDLQSARVKGTYGSTWNLLKNRADAAKQQLKQGKKNDFAAITTVLISKADADELYREENIDILNASNARHFMESYNLLGFIVADDATETLKMLYDDGSKTFEEHSYTMLSREQDGTFKKLINLIASSK